MANYEGENCSKCGKPFEAGDDIVVCPDCGAPYHRTCSKELTQCVYFAKHETGEAYKSKEQRDRERMEAEARKVDGRGELRCSRCGTMNAPDGLFCEVCGTPLKKQIDQQQRDAAGQESNEPGGFYGPGMGGIPFHTIPYNPETTPFGGLNPDEEIDGIPVKDLAIFLGQNSHYFLPRFKQMKEKNSNTWNWAAMFLTHYYLLFRKVTWLGVLVFLVSLLLSAPSLMSDYDMLLHLYSPDAASTFNEDTVLMMASVFSLLTVAVHVFLGMFSNRIYMNQVFRKIRKIKAEYGNSPEYHSMLVQNGSVSIGGAVAVIALQVVLSFVSVFVMMSLML